MRPIQNTFKAKHERFGAIPNFYYLFFLARCLAKQKRNCDIPGVMDEGRVLAIVAGILVARHLKTTEDLFDTRDSPRTRSMVIAAVQWAKRIMGKIDEECSS